MGDDRKTVLKFAVNAKQISTPLLDWANRLWIEGGWKIVGPRGWVGKWQTTAGEKGKAIVFSIDLLGIAFGIALANRLLWAP